MPLMIFSSAFNPGDFIPQTYTCDGENFSPPLTLSGIPDSAESLALILSDPDAPSGNFIHWVVWNIPAFSFEIDENQLPEPAVEGMNDTGEPGFAGPCPPDGETHRYFFNLYALDTAINLPNTAKAEDLEVAMADHIVDTAELMGQYKRMIK